MARKRTTQTKSPAQVTDYRYAETRKNIPAAGLAAQGKVQEIPKTRYAYDPHLPPALRFDPTGGADELPELLRAAQERPLTRDEARLLAAALRQHQPWLEWAGKHEAQWFEVDPIALHIHERVSAQAIIKTAQREPLQRSFFGDPELEYREAVQFYQHDVDWTNRLILGDSLMVMSSLARREDLAGKVQMIYIDPPYGIKFSSNFQAQVGNRNVKDREADLTREPEQVKAYRDTWQLGIHSYLAYLRDRLYIAKELLTASGSVFVQISDENVHRVRMVMDEIFGADNFVSQIVFKKASSATTVYIANVCDYILWYAKNKEMVKYYQLYLMKIGKDASGFKTYRTLEMPNGTRRSVTRSEMRSRVFPEGTKLCRLDPLISQSGTDKSRFPVTFEGGTYKLAKDFWKTNPEGMERLIKAGRVVGLQKVIRFVRYIDDFSAYELNHSWTDVLGAMNRNYVVETNPKVIERCMLMTTDPGDLVLDPTCGGGTTAYVAEQWGRRWIAIDTSRVAVALARQRLLTAKYDYYALEHPAEPLHPAHNKFVYQTIPHITLRSIAQNQALDPIFAEWEPILEKKLAALNAALTTVTPAIRTKLLAKLAEKERTKGKRAITDADQRRWQLPPERWAAWEVPFDTDADWPAALCDALNDYRAAWQQKMAQVNETIAASAPSETLVDQPEVVSGILRVSGPFTVEGVQPVEELLDIDSPIGGAPDDLAAFSAPNEPTNAEAYLEKMIRLLRQDGVRFPNNKILKFARLEPLAHDVLHAAGEWGEDARRVAVAFGPQYGPITAQQVEECLRAAYRRSYDDVVFAGFTVDGAAQAIIQDDPNPQVRCHLAHIRPDVNMGDLLKDTPSSQLFTVFGLPRVELTRDKHGEWIVEMEGVDIYDPVHNNVQATTADKVAAWFVDSDYDGRTFCITQAFFPDKKAWRKLARALKSVVSADRFAAFSSTRSLPFAAGEHHRVAVKVIDPRGNEVMRVLNLERESAESYQTASGE